MSDLTDIPDNQGAMGGLQQIEPPRILSNRDRDIFLDLLNADPEPTEAAEKAAARFNKGYFVGNVYYFQTPCP